jgi:hypothetical protein
LNRFKYPDDPRVHGGFFTSSWIKYINGQKFLFATDMYAGQLAGFRFSPSTDGEIAIPCLLMNVGMWDKNSNYPTRLGSDKDFIWMDKNGDGAIQSDEFTFKENYDNPYAMAVWVDQEGNIWKGVRENGVRFIPIKQLNSFGVPVYDFADSKLLDLGRSDLGTNGIKRLVFDSQNDELYVAGFSKQKPDMKLNGNGNDTWWCMGSTVCMYKDILKGIKANSMTNYRNLAPNWKIFLPFAADGDPGNESDAKSFTVEGDYMFVTLARNGLINVYKRNNGEYLGQIAPGAEINKESGWTDIDYAINVIKTADEYLIFNEENAFAKVVMYRMKSFETNDQLFPDLVPSNIEFLNAENQVITKPVQKQAVHFRVKVTNQGAGMVPSGKQFADGKSFKVNFTVKNLETGASRILYSDTCTLSLLPGKDLIITSFSKTKAYEWVAEKGKFSITAQANPMLGSNITECDRTNNSITVNTNSYDTLHVDVQPVNQSTIVGGTATFSTVFLGSEPISYKWFVNGKEQANSNSNKFTLSGLGVDLNNAKIKVIATNGIGSQESNEAILKVINPYGETKIGYLLKQSWYNINGTAIADLTGNLLYPGNPDSISFINSFELPANVADHYGVRVSGWIIAPETGNYTFYIASDDNGQLKLSTDSLPQNLRHEPIAFVPEWSDSRQFSKFPAQTSELIYLESGKKYFVEAIFKEEAGGDNLAVAWKLPSGTNETPIPSSRLAFYTSKTTGIEKNLVTDRVHIQVFPSPADDFIYIKTSLMDGILEFNISDIFGRSVKKDKIYQTESSSSRIDLTDISSGFYLLTVHSQQQTASIKFIIKR